MYLFIPEYESVDNAEGKSVVLRQMVKHSTVSSAYMFKYDILREQIDVDFERMVNIPEGSEPVEDNPFAE